MNSMLEKINLKKSLIARRDAVKQKIINELLEDMAELDFKIPIIRTRSWWDLFSPYKYLTYFKPIIEWTCDECLSFKLSEKNKGYEYGLHLRMYSGYIDPTIDEENFSRWESSLKVNFENFKIEIVDNVNKHLISNAFYVKELK